MDERVVNRVPPLRAHLLGPVRIAVGESVVPERSWSRRASRALLLLLLISPDHRLPRDRVLDILWPDAAPASADRELRKAVHALRRALQPDLRHGRDSAYVEVGAESISLRSSVEVWVDVEVFEERIAAARMVSRDARRTQLREALTLYRADLLPDDPYVDWAVAERDRLRRRRRQALLDLAQLDIDAAEPLASVPTLETLLEADGTDEAVLRALMRALATAGRRDEAIRWYRRGAALLRDELDIEPEDETRELANEIVAVTPPPPGPLQSPISIRADAHVPAPPNPLIGRVREIERLQDLLLTRDIRLVTVTGPGGVGKTRLAQEAARQLADDFADGVCFVALASIQDPSLVVPTIARALGLPESGTYSGEEMLQAALRERALLLVLDNLEQVIDVAPHIAVLLEGTDRLKILATSREPLRLRAEYEVVLPPLSVPQVAPSTRSRALVRYEAVELFLHRAHAVRPGFVLTDENAAAVGTICKMLDGLPLAIELAAAQARTMSPGELLAGLTDRFALLAGGFRDLPSRQQSLHDAIAWSYDLLSPSRQVLFRRIAVFAGGFTADAAAAVVESGNGGERPSIPTIGDDVDSLVTSSLLGRTEEEDGPRYAMLESIRAFGLGELASRREEEAARRAHAGWFLDLAERIGPPLAEKAQPKWLDRLEAELDNFRIALEWSLDRRDATTALRLAGALRRLWFARGYLVEGRDWLERALARSEHEPTEIRARAMLAAGELSFFLEDFGRSKSLAEMGLEISRALGNGQGITDALLGLGHIARMEGELEVAASCLQEGIDVAHSVGDDASLALLKEAMGKVLVDQDELDRAELLYVEALEHNRLAGYERGTAAILTHLAELAALRGNIDEAIQMLEESLGIVRRLRDAFAIASVLGSLGKLLAGRGDQDRALETFGESLSIFWEHRLDAHAADVIRLLASLAVAMGEPERAARLFGAAEAFCRETGVTLTQGVDVDTANPKVSARAALGGATFESLYASGAALTLERAIAEALREKSSARGLQEA